MLPAFIAYTGAIAITPASAGTTPPIVIDGDPCGVGDWQNPDADTTVVVQNDLNSTAASATVDAGYDCDNLVTIACDNNAPDDIFAQNEPTAKFNSTTRPRVPLIQSAPQGNDICQSYFAASVDGDGDFWMCVGSNTLSDNGSGSIWFEFNAIDGQLNAGDFALRLSKTGSTAIVSVLTYDGASWTEQTLAPGSFYAAIQSPDEYFGEGCVNLTDNGLVTPGTCLTAGIGTAYTSTGNSLSAQLKDTGGTTELGFSNCGLLKVVKDTNPDGGAGTFTYTVNPALGAEANGGDYTLINDDDSETWINVLEGTYTIAEDTPAAPWVTASVVCDNNDGTPANAVISANATTTCTITNHRLPTITVIKQTDPDGEPGDFGFDIDGDAVADHTLADGESFLITPTSPGPITITELANPDFDLASISCGGVGTNSDPLESVTIDVGYMTDADTDITCTFTNELKAGTLTLEKVVDAGNDPTPLDASTVTLEASSGGVTALSGSSGVSGDLDEGTYDLSESNLDSEYALTSIVCNGVPVADLNAPQVAVAAGDDITCVFTNTFQEDPGVTITKTADPTEITGPATINYTVTVTNTGNVPLDESLDDVLDANGVDVGVALTYSSGTGTDDGTWDVGEVSVYTGSYSVSQAELDAGGTSWVNTACVVDAFDNPIDVDGDGELDCASDTTTFNPDPSVTITKTADPTEITGPDTITYTVTVTNTGNIALDESLDDVLDANGVNVGVALTYDSGTGTDDGTWDVGEVSVYTGSYTVSQAELDAGGTTWANTACVVDEFDNPIDVDGDGELDCASDTTTFNPDPSVTITKTADPNEITGPTTINYTITVVNTGNIAVDEDLTDTLAVNDIPAGNLTLTYESGDADDGVWSVGETTVYSASFEVTQAMLDAGDTDWLNTACVTDGLGGDDVDGDGDPDCSSDSTTFTPDPSVTVLKSADPTSITGPAAINYTITVVNTGNVAVTEDLTDTLAVNNIDIGNLTLTYVSGDGDDGKWTVGETTVYSASFEVTQEMLDAGDTEWANTVCVTDGLGGEDVDGDGDPDCSTGTTTFTPDPSVIIDKTADPTAITGPATITYTVTVTNDGNIALAEDLYDVLEANGVVVPGAVTLTYDALAAGNTGSNDGTWNVGEVSVYTGTFDVTQEMIDAGQTSWVNTACVPDVDGDTVDECDDATTTFTPDPSVTISKSASPTEITGPATITYTVTVINTGNIAVPEDLTDTLAANGIDVGNLTLSYSSGNGANDNIWSVGEVSTYTATYDVTQAMLDAGQTEWVNTACVTDGLGGTDVDADGDADCSSATTTFTPDPSVTISKSADPTQITGPATINYTITVVNNGNIAVDESLSDTLAANGIEVGDLELTYVSGDGDDGLWTVGETTVYSASYAVTQEMLDAGETSWLNTACVTDANGDPTDVDGDGVDECDDATTTFTPDPSVTVLKTADPTEITGPATINYTITVVNTGNIAVDEDLTDTLAANGIDVGPLVLTYVSGDADDGKWTVGETTVYSASFNVTQEMLDAGETVWANTACVTDGLGGDDVDGDGDPDCSTGTTTFTPDPSVIIDKTADPTEISGPATITYTVTVTNDGNIALAEDLYDVLEANGVVVPGAVTLTYDAGNAANTGADDNIWKVGETSVYTGTFEVTQDMLDAGQTTWLNTACVPDVDGDDADECDDATTTFTPDPDATVVKSTTLDPNEITAPGTIPYTVVVDNTGNVALDVTVVDELTKASGVSTLSLSGPTGDTDGDNRLDVNEVWTYTGSYTVTQDDINDGGNIVNEACIGDIDESGAVDADECSSVTTPIIQSPAASVVKSTDSTYYSAVGDVINYTIAITNDGNVSLSEADLALQDLLNGVNVTGDLAGPFVNADGTGDPVGDLDPTDPWYYTYSYTIDADDLTPQATVTNVVCVNADGGDPECDEVETPSAGLDIVKTITAVDGDPGPGSVDAAGDIIEYEIVVANTGATDLSPDVNDVLTTVTNGNENLTLSGPVESQGPDGVLEPTETWTFTASYEATLDDLNAGGVIGNEACASNTDPDVAEVCDDVETPIVQLPAASVVKTTDSTYYSAVGDVINYTIAVTNDGNVSLSEAELALEDLLNGIDVTAEVDGPFTDAAGNNPAAGELDPTDTWYLTYSYTIQASDLDDQDTVTNVVCVNADGGDPECDEVETPSAGLVIEKTITSVTGGTAAGEVDSAGDIINYQVVVTNTGAIDLTPNVIDIIGQEDGFGGVLSLQGPTESGTGDGILSPGETWTYTTAWQVSLTSMNNGNNIDNEACAANTDPSVAQVCDDVTTPIVQLPAASVVKSTNSTYYSAVGDVIDYTIAVTNDGNVSLSDEELNLEDLLNGIDVTAEVDGPFTNAAGTDPAVGELDPTDTWYYTYSYTIVAGDLADGATVTNVVCVNADGGDPECSEVETPSASLDIVKTVAAVDNDPGPGSADAAGDIIEYEIVVTNTGAIDLTPDVTDILTTVTNGDESLTLSGPVESFGDDDIMEPNETWTFTASYEVTLADMNAGGVIDNEACASNTDPDVAEECDDVSTPIVQLPSAAVAKSTDSTYYSAVGDVIDYTIAVTNDGNVSLSVAELELEDLLNGIDVTADVDGPFTDEDGTIPAVGELDPNGTWYFTYSYTVDADDLTPQAVVTNVVCVNADGGDPECDEVETPSASLDIDKSVTSVTGGTAAGEVDSAGDIINYEVVVTNTGATDLTPSVSDVVSQIGGISGNYSLVGPTESGDADGILKPTETWTYTLQYEVSLADMNNGNDINNEACASNTDPDVAEECDDVDTPILQLPSAAVEKSTDSTYYSAVGDVINYTIAVTNDGNVSLSEAELALEDLLNGIDVTAEVDGPFTDAAGNNPAAGELDPTDTWYFTYTYTIQASDLDDQDTVTNVVCVNADGGEPECDEVETPSASLDIDKSVSSITGGTADGKVDSAGDIINYEIVVTNTGAIDLAPDVTDELVNSLGDVSNPTLSGPVESISADGVMQPTETWTYTASYTVTLADMNDGDNIDNEACASNTDPNVAEECDDVTTEIVQLPDHSLTKTFIPDEVNVGDTATFEIVYTNTGNVTLSDISIDDDVDTLLDVTGPATWSTDPASNDAIVSCPDGDGNEQTITCLADELDPGESVTITVEYTAVPLVDELVPDTGQTSGSNFVFYFENGYILYGSTETSTGTLIDPDGNEVDAGDWSIEGRNQDVFFTAPGDAPAGGAFQLHLSCSEVFIDGYGDTGPTLADNPEWQIAAYQVYRFNTNGLFKTCGQIFAPFEVTNTASAQATPAGGTLSPNPIMASDDLVINNPAPIEVSRERVRRGDVEIQFFNTDYEEDLTIDIIRIEWDGGELLLEGSYQGSGTFDIGDGTSPVNASVDVLMDSRSRDWLRLSFDCRCAPDGLTVTIVTSTGATLTHEYGTL